MSPTYLADAIALQEVKRALVIKLRHHGDVLLTSPVLQILKNHAPHIEIDALVYADTAPMLAGHPALSQLHCIERQWKEQGFWQVLPHEWKLAQTLRARRYDLVIHLTDHPRGAWLARWLRARWAVAPARERSKRLWKKAFTHLVPKLPNAQRHTVELHLDALRRLGIQPGMDERRLILNPGTDAENSVRQLLLQHTLNPQQFIHIHPASRWLFKCWSQTEFAQLIDTLLARGERIVLTAAPDGREIAMIDAMIARLTTTAPSLVNLSGQLNLKQLAALSAAAKLFIGVDSAPMHIASAMQTPVVALFGPSGDKEWGPWQVVHRTITSQSHPCRPCGLDGCGGGKISECLTTIPSQRVLAAVDELLASGHASVRRIPIDPIPATR